MAMILFKLIFSNLLGPLKLKATRMATFNHQCFQVQFDFAVQLFSTSKKYHAFLILTSSIMKYDRDR